MRINLLRTIRLDPSDGFVFDPPASPGEWAVTGAFMFTDSDPALLSRRAQQAFRAGFLGLTSFGWSTLAVVVQASPQERADAVTALARYLLDKQGAPSIEVARSAAEDEIAYAQTLAQHPVQTLVALHRTVTASGDIREQFRTLSAATARTDSKMPCSAGAFAIVEDEDSAAPEPGDVDLAALARAMPRGHP